MRVSELFRRSTGFPRERRCRARGRRLGAGLLFAILGLAIGAEAQTLARPGWSGSGMTAERWWPHAVLCEVEPGSLADHGTAAENSTLRRLSMHLDDLQTLGIDAVLLRNLEAEGEPARSSSVAAKGASPLAVEMDPRFGTLDEFDDLVRDAVRHGMRVLVELRPGAHGANLTDDARFWLNRGVTGISLSRVPLERDDADAIRGLRGMLRGYVGERVLIAAKTTKASNVSAQVDASSAHAGVPGAAREEAAARPDQPDLSRISLAAPDAGAAAMRASLERARLMLGAQGPVPLLSADEHAQNPAVARLLAASLLGSSGAILLRADDLDLQHASDGAGQQSSVFAWYRLWSGLHRGNAAMRSGHETLLDHDSEGALVWVRQSRGGGAPIVTISNVTGKPLRLSLVADVERLHLRGSFLRTLARSDGGMGAMPLREIVLPPFAVYAGELSR